MDQFLLEGQDIAHQLKIKFSGFMTKEKHRVMLEPEGLKSNLVYPNGISTSLPLQQQEVMLKTIKGLEKLK